jgi:hypothetical protein
VFRIQDRARRSFTITDQAPGESLAIYAQEGVDNESSDVLVGAVARLGKSDSVRVGSFWLRHRWGLLRPAQRLVAVAHCPGARGWQLEVLQLRPDDGRINWLLGGATSQLAVQRPGLTVVSPQEPWIYEPTIQLFGAATPARLLNSTTPRQNGDPIYLRNVYGFSRGVDDSSTSGGPNQAPRCFGQIVLSDSGPPTAGTPALHSWTITTPRSTFAFTPPDPAMFSRGLTRFTLPWLVVSLDPDVYTPPAALEASEVAVYMQWSSRNARQEEGFRVVDVGEASNYEVSEAGS